MVALRRTEPLPLRPVRKELPLWREQRIAYYAALAKDRKPLFDHLPARFTLAQLTMIDALVDAERDRYAASKAEAVPS